MNKYEILQTIGQGEYGVVLKAKNKQTGDLVAIKKFKQDDSDQQNKRVILRQVKILKTLNHENIIQLKEAFRKKCRIYLVCEYVDKNLLELMESGCINAYQLKNYAYQLLKGLAYMHSLNIIHRDIKPENVLISKSNIVKICDLGFARNIPSNGRMTDYVATRWYRPPQLILGRDDYDRSIDIWAVACVMAEMIDGEPLFGGQNDLDQLYLIQKCLGPLTPQHQEYFLKNQKFVGMKFPQIHNLQSLQRRYIGKMDKLGIDLLKKMLKMQPSSRITAQQALNHPFFNRSSSQSQIQFKRTNYKQHILLEENNASNLKANIPLNNFINENISSRPSKQQKQTNKATVLSKLKKNQQQTQYCQDSVHEQFNQNSLNNKTKSLGKKGPTNSIRQKTIQKYSQTNEKYGHKVAVKPSKSNLNQGQYFKKAQKFYEDQQDEYYEDEFEKEEPETSQINMKDYIKDSRQQKDFKEYRDPRQSRQLGQFYGNTGNQSPQNIWNMNSNIFQGVHNKSKSKQKMLSNRGYGKQTDSPTKDEYQKLKKNLKNLKRQNISIVFNNNTYNLNLMDH